MRSACRYVTADDLMRKVEDEAIFLFPFFSDEAPVLRRCTLW
jgi:hypothetical protein